MWLEETGCPDPDWEEWHLTWPDKSFQLRVCTGHDEHYMLIKIDRDGTRHNYGHSISTRIHHAKMECEEKALSFSQLLEVQSMQTQH